MTRRRPQGLISVRVPPEPPPKTSDSPLEEVVSLPPPNVLDAGAEKFLALTHIGVARPGDEVTFHSFDFNDRKMLRVVLGLVYMHMRATYVSALAQAIKAEDEAAK